MTNASVPPRSWYIKWTCPLCKATGTIDPTNDVDMASEAIARIHKMISPDCPNAEPLSAEQVERPQDIRDLLDDAQRFIEQHRDDT